MFDLATHLLVADRLAYFTGAWLLVQGTQSMTQVAIKQKLGETGRW